MRKISPAFRQNLLIGLGILLIAIGAWGTYMSTKNYGSEDQPEVYSSMIPTMQFGATGKPNSDQSTVEAPVQTTESTQVNEVNSLGNTAIRNYAVHDQKDPDVESPNIPDWIEIPAIGLEAPVVSADYNFTQVEGETFGQWTAPSMNAAGWHPNSALMGKSGNTVINGHHNEYGEVFGKLVDLHVGDIVYVYSKGIRYAFTIANRMILQERFMDAKTRLENARWIGSTDDVRLTLVTCWPKESNTHRLILVGRPIAVSQASPTP